MAVPVAVMAWIAFIYNTCCEFRQQMLRGREGGSSPPRVLLFCSRQLVWPAARAGPPFILYEFDLTSSYSGTSVSLGVSRFDGFDPPWLTDPSSFKILCRKRVIILIVQARVLTHRHPPPIRRTRCATLAWVNLSSLSIRALN